MFALFDAITRQDSTHFADLVQVKGNPFQNKTCPQNSCTPGTYRKRWCYTCVTTNKTHVCNCIFNGTHSRHLLHFLSIMLHTLQARICNFKGKTHVSMNVSVRWHSFQDHAILIQEQIQSCKQHTTFCYRGTVTCEIIQHIHIYKGSP